LDNIAYLERRAYVLQPYCTWTGTGMPPNVGMYANLYVPSPHMPGARPLGKIAQRGYDDYGGFICKLFPDAEERRPISKWTKYLVQEVDTKGTLGIIASSMPGAGKGTWLKFLRLALGEHLCAEFTGISILTAAFNAKRLLGKRLTCFNEVYSNDGYSSSMGAIKTHIADEYKSYNEKYQVAIEAQDYSMSLVFSNERKPIRQEKGARRFMYVEASGEMIGDIPYFVKLNAHMKHKDKAHTAEYASGVLAYICESVDIDGWRPDMIKRTQYTQKLINEQMDSLDNWVMEGMPLKMLLEQGVRKGEYETVSHVLPLAPHTPDDDQVQEGWVREQAQRDRDARKAEMWKSEDVPISTEELTGAFKRFCKSDGVADKFAKRPRTFIPALAKIFGGIEKKRALCAGIGDLGGKKRNVNGLIFNDAALEAARTYIKDTVLRDPTFCAW
jgi:hypothetical protein